MLHSSFLALPQAHGRNLSFSLLGIGHDSTAMRLLHRQPGPRPDLAA